ncbi:phosphatidylserine decarboxylase-domain-containing protein [Pisolithus croceorrhizus]|nr:phosphatidylserine decarboxylase-domain-containing protein [Pisolithus croceorrhizus]KAI6107495.1 phosphatidylserine decarboxylase-domain-containing protein [Pisolithus croceorrhizus]KAI6165553.1 phosphatidylserine decarboxylase-domain-containing protein [Pisolithus thermaeus]
MPATTVCRWLPEDPAVVDAFVHDLLYQSRYIHGRHPDSCERFADVGDDLEEKASLINIPLDLSRMRHCYRFGSGEEEVYRVRALHELTDKFKKLTEGDGALYATFNKMFREAPAPKNGRQRSVRNYVDLMEVISTNLTSAPTYREGPSAMVAGVPYYGIIARLCNTHAGYEAFTHPRVNEKFCEIFTKWHEYLESSDSAGVLHSGNHGWLSPSALVAMVRSAGGDPAQQRFEDIYKCDPTHPTYGFGSYDAFFVRELKVVPAPFPDDPSIVNSACTSTVHDLYYTLRERDEFWIKNTPYSLSHILAGDKNTKHFIGGTLLQAMLGSLDYHRWHSPVKGTVVKTHLISGASHAGSPHPTYYAACLDDDRQDLDVVSRSQDFVTAIATRALIFIQAEEPVGLMCFVGVGLGEVSTCKITVNVGDALQKGSELGRFHFGGSTHCLIFRKGLTVAPIDQNGEDLVDSKVQVGTPILKIRAN